jgi:flagellar motor switch/type III secretory pathway protein FliN
MPKKKEEVFEEDIIEEGGEEEELEEDAGDIENEGDLKGLPPEEDIPGGEDLPPEEDEPEEVQLETARMTADVPVQVVAVVGKKTVTVKDLVSVKAGQVLDFARPVNDLVDLVAGGKLVAKGELVDIDGKIGVKIVKMMR